MPSNIYVSIATINALIAIHHGEVIPCFSCYFISMRHFIPEQYYSRCKCFRTDGRWFHLKLLRNFNPFHYQKRKWAKDERQKPRRMEAPKPTLREWRGRGLGNSVTTVTSQAVHVSVIYLAIHCEIFNLMSKMGTSAINFNNRWFPASTYKCYLCVPVFSMISFQKYGLDYFLLKIDYLESLHLLDKSLKPTIVVSQQGFLHTCNKIWSLIQIVISNVHNI